MDAAEAARSPVFRPELQKERVVIPEDRYVPPSSAFPPSNELIDVKSQLLAAIENLPENPFQEEVIEAAANAYSKVLTVTTGVPRPKVASDAKAAVSNPPRARRRRAAPALRRRVHAP